MRVRYTAATGFIEWTKGGVTMQKIWVGAVVQPDTNSGTRPPLYPCAVLTNQGNRVVLRRSCAKPAHPGMPGVGAFRFDAAHVTRHSEVAISGLNQQTVEVTKSPNGKTQYLRDTAHLTRIVAQPCPTLWVPPPVYPKATTNKMKQALAFWKDGHSSSHVSKHVRAGGGGSVGHAQPVRQTCQLITHLTPTHVNLFYESLSLSPVAGFPSEASSRAELYQVLL